MLEAGTSRRRRRRTTEGFTAEDGSGATTSGVAGHCQAVSRLGWLQPTCRVLAGTAACAAGSAPGTSEDGIDGLLVMLDKGRGRLKETVEALRVKDPGLLEGLGALHVAAGREQLEVCKYLIEELQVDVNGVDKGGRTPLFFVIRDGVGIVKYLLDHGADPNKVNNNGITLLHEATMSGNGEAVKLLLAEGAYVDPVASCGTPLHCAASKGHDDIMKILLDHNADCNKLVNGKTPLNTAGDANSKNCIYLLLKAGADRKAALTYAVEKLQSGKVVSTDFVNCIMGDVAANSILPDDDEPQSKRKIRAAGFQKLASFSFKEEEYLSAAMSYTVVY